MTNHKRLSQISFAAAALLVAALPALAQTESTNRRNALQTVKSSEIATLRYERLEAPKAELKVTAAENVTAVSTQPSRDKFNQAIAQATSSTPGFLSNGTISESDWQKTQRVGKSSESTNTKGITFVPSRGQKLPE
jgi:hypothetical protein